MVAAALNMLAEGGAASWSISSLIADVGTIFSTASGLILENPVPAAFVGISIVGAGIGLFKRVIRVR